MEALNGIGLEVAGLSCRYERDWVIKNLSFSVKPGEALAVVGPSGSGKTTLAYCLTGIIPQKIEAEVRGRILVDGRDVSNSPIRENAKLIGVVLQNYEMQIFGLTVEEDLVFGLENLGLDEVEISSRLEWALETFGLRKYRSYHVHELSGGLRQRLAIASSVITAPKYLVMDDPTANLDWRGIVELRKTLQRLKEEGKGLTLMVRRLKGLEPVIDKIIEIKANNRSISNLSSQEPELQASKPGAEISLRFEGVWFRYSGDRDYALRDIWLNIEGGKCIALMGPNGSGKTTLVKHVNGLLKPTKGRVLVLGKDTRNYSPAQLAKHVAFVFQDPDKHIVCETVWEEVTFGPRNLGLGYEYAEEALRILGLLDRKEDPPYLLSTGEKIRLSMAGALAMNPEILVLDEPTTGQDEETLSIMASMIKRLKSMGRTIVVVTHDSDFAAAASDEIIVVRDGALAARGKPEEILLNNSLIEEFELEPLSSKSRGSVEVMAPG
ncbi:MAG: energy-coupling factor ABC transporter ATP-binding protein [Aigarchaeota archaeon]|nr:energy-coupling factor ABC transporter ATP-binding protein [Aigarchaeota archaeon]MDW8021604.1 ABC transporter ATP-binding protein [Nitrososphaerota archaeon]